MKTRSNMPLFVVETNDVKALSNSQIDLLRCGDYLVKKDASGEHAYKVTYKKDGVGMCLTYHDASCVETVSYDFTDGNWVYNSTDKADLPINVEDASFEPIYCHPIQITFTDNKGSITMLIFNNDATPFTASTFIDWIEELYEKVGDNIRIMTSGAIIGDGSNALCPACFLVRRTSSYPYGVVGVKSNGTADSYDFSNKSTFVNSCSTFNDGVNKIN